MHTPPRKLPLFCFGCARLAGSGHQVASQLEPGAHPELSQARNGPAAPSLKHVPQGHFRSGSRLRNGQQVDLTEATNGWATPHQRSQG